MDTSSTQATIYSDPVYTPTRSRKRTCLGSDGSEVLYSGCGVITERIETETKSEECESRFKNTDVTLYETKVVISFKVQIYEKWSTDLLVRTSSYYTYLSQLYIRAFLVRLQTIQRVTGGTSNYAGLSSLSTRTQCLFSTVRVVRFTRVTSNFILSGRKRREIDEDPSEILAELEVVYDTLAEADGSTDSGLTEDAEKELTDALQDAVEDEIEAETDSQVTDADEFKEGDPNYLDTAKVEKTEMEDVILTDETKTTTSTTTTSAPTTTTSTTVTTTTQTTTTTSTKSNSNSTTTNTDITT